MCIRKNISIYNIFLRDYGHETCKLVLQILLYTHTHWLYYKVSDEYAELGFLYIGERFFIERSRCLCYSTALCFFVPGLPSRMVYLRRNISFRLVIPTCKYIYNEAGGCSVLFHLVCFSLNVGEILFV